MTLFNVDTTGELLLATTLDFVPRVKERPRHTKGGTTYTPKTTLEAEQALREAFCDAHPDFVALEGPLDVRWWFAADHLDIEVSRCADYESRKLRGDLDNYMKLVSDGLNKVLYVDDRQIVRTFGAKK